MAYQVEPTDRLNLCCGIIVNKIKKKHEKIKGFHGLFNIYWLKICNTMGKNKNKRYQGSRFNMNDKNEKRNTEEHVEEVTAVNPQDVAEIKPEIVDNFDSIEAGDETPQATPTGEIKADIETEDSLEKEVEHLKVQLEKEKKEYLFLMAEFDNFRKRTLKEKSEIIKNAGEKVFKGLLPIVDDMERGIKASEETSDINTVKEGMVLIYNKLIKYMEANGVKAFEDNGDTTFDADRHEAITAVPVQDENLKGKILDTIEKGYTINDKVLRHARVVVGQ